jgi:hypothetical protein
MGIGSAPAVRVFETGATRDADDTKYDYEAFFSPLVLERRAAFMHKNRIQSNGERRDGDNWQKGIPLDQYMKSMFRHFVEIWRTHRGNADPSADISEMLCALMFNAEGYMHEILKRRGGV